MEIILDMKALIAPRQIGQQAITIDVPDWTTGLQDFLVKLKKGVTAWIDSGRAPHVRAETGGKFTLADLADYTPDCFVKGTALGACLQEAGITICTITAIDTDVDSAILDIDADINLYMGEE